MNDQSERPIGEGISLEHLDEFLGEARSLGYAFPHYDTAETHEKFIILRHDIDVEPLLAIPVAETQAKHDVSAVYYVMLRNPLYNASAPKYVACMKRLIELGHRVGLHFDASVYSELQGPEIISAIEREMRILGELLSPASPTPYMSFHKPNPFILNHDITTPGFVSSYNRAFFRDIRYISDSGGAWKECGILELIRSGIAPRIQFTSHPVWWACGGSTVNQRLGRMLEFKQDQLSVDLAETINDPSRGIILHRVTTSLIP